MKTSATTTVVVAGAPPEPPTSPLHPTAYAQRACGERLPPLMVAARPRRSPASATALPQSPGWGSAKRLAAPAFMRRGGRRPPASALPRFSARTLYTPQPSGTRVRRDATPNAGLEGTARVKPPDVGVGRLDR